MERKSMLMRQWTQMSKLKVRTCLRAVVDCQDPHESIIVLGLLPRHTYAQASAGKGSQGIGT